MHGQHNIRPIDTFTACAGTKLILLGDSVNSLHKAAPESTHPEVKLMTF